MGRFTPQLEGRAPSKARHWIVLNDASASRTEIEARAQRYIVERLVQEADDDDSLGVINLDIRARRCSHDFGGQRVLASMADLRRSGFTASPDDEGARYHWPEGRRLGGTNIEAGLEAVSSLIEELNIDNPHILYLGDGVVTGRRGRSRGAGAVAPQVSGVSRHRRRKESRRPVPSGGRRPNERHVRHYQSRRGHRLASVRPGRGPQHAKADEHHRGPGEREGTDDGGRRLPERAGKSRQARPFPSSPAATRRPHG